MITTTDVEQNTSNPFTRPVKRNVAPCGGSLQDSMMEFFLDIDTDILSSNDLDALEVLFDDLEWLHVRSVNESLHFAKKSSTGARSISRKWYKQNRGRVKTLQARMKKSKAAAKKKEIMAKSDRTPVKKKKKKKYNTKKHTINESKLRAGVKASVEKLFEPLMYRVIREFTVADGIDACLYEQIHHKFGCYTLIKRSGEKILFKCEKADIEKYIKLESEGITLEDIDV